MIPRGLAPGVAFALALFSAAAWGEEPELRLQPPGEAARAFAPPAAPAEPSPIDVPGPVISAKKAAPLKAAEAPKAGAASGASDSDMMPLFAEEGKPAGEQPRKGSGLSVGWTLASSGFWLGVVMLAICGVLWVIKRVVPGATSSFKSPAAEVLGRTLLDSRKCLYVVKIGRRIVLVGSSPERLSPLAEVTDPAEVGEIVALAAGERGARAFQAELSRESGLYGEQKATVAIDHVVQDLPGGEGQELTEESAAPDGALGRIRGQIARVKQRLEQLRKVS